MKRKWRIGIAALILAALPALGRPSMPTVQDILDRYLTALGGRAELEQITSMTIRGTLELPAQKITGATVEFFQPPDRFAAITQIPGYGTLRTVYDGDKGWKEDPQQGAIELSGLELADLRRRSDLHWNLKLSSFYPGLKVIGQDIVDGKKAWKLEAADGGWTYDFWFAADSGLLVQFDTDRHTPDGKSSVKIGDYRRVGHVLFAFSAVESSTVVNWSRKLTEVKFNEPADGAVFTRGMRRNR